MLLHLVTTSIISIPPHRDYSAPGTYFKHFDKHKYTDEPSPNISSSAFKKKNYYKAMITVYKSLHEYLQWKKKKSKGINKHEI